MGDQAVEWERKFKRENSMKKMEGKKLRDDDTD